LSLREHPRGIIFKAFVQPRSSKNAISGAHADAIKINITAPPVDNAANKMCIQHLSKCLGVSKSSLEIISGHTGRTKQILFKCGEDNVTEKERKRMADAVISLIS